MDENGGTMKLLQWINENNIHGQTFKTLNEIEHIVIKENDQRVRIETEPKKLAMFDSSKIRTVPTSYTSLKNLKRADILFPHFVKYASPLFPDSLEYLNIRGDLESFIAPRCLQTLHCNSLPTNLKELKLEDFKFISQKHKFTNIDGLEHMPLKTLYLIGSINFKLNPESILEKLSLYESEVSQKTTLPKSLKAFLVSNHESQFSGGENLELIKINKSNIKIQTKNLKKLYIKDSNVEIIDAPKHLDHLILESKTNLNLQFFSTIKQFECTRFYPNYLGKSESILLKSFHNQTIDLKYFPDNLFLKSCSNLKILLNSKNKKAIDYCKKNNIDFILKEDSFLSEL